MFYVFTQNINFTGFRNVGKHSTHFDKGIAEVEKKETASVLKTNFGYLCPELDMHDFEKVIELRGEDPKLVEIYGDKVKASVEDAAGFPDDSPGKGVDEPGQPDEHEQGIAEDGKVEVRFLTDKGIYKTGQSARFKPETAAKKVEAGEVEYANPAQA